MKQYICVLCTALALTACGGSDDNDGIGGGDPIERAFGAFDIQTTMGGYSVLSFGILTQDRMAVVSEYGEIAIYHYSVRGTALSGYGKHYYLGDRYSGKIDSGTVSYDTIDANFSVTGMGKGTLRAEHHPQPAKQLKNLAGTWVDTADGISSYVISEDGEVTGSDVYGCQVLGSVEQRMANSMVYEGHITVFNCGEYNGERDVIMAWLDDIQAAAVFSFNDELAMFNLLQ
ncbi:hypothetical protein FCL40_05085 [Ferrimonas sediminicola]|uniref:Lipoprotein n=1 Tax=Ferrimonas sediminicola TaxID=2569538 RepID=A0A4U1BIB8_9GAMM|nr:hypothetical protein [Ferrimonas sediminicola]TKB50526.1 hypothetical protein FCL40_05085 [Ferrimonas sediminicola]